MTYLVCAYDAEEWVYSPVEELYFARNCQQISKSSLLLVSDVHLDFEKITIAA
jgi:hypothetical protein